MIKIAFVLIAIPMILIFIGVIKSNIGFFDIGKMIKEHLLLFKNCRYQYCVFYVFPAFIGVGIALIYKPDVFFVEQLNVVISILMAALLSIISIILSKEYKDLDDGSLIRVKKVIGETNNAVVFSVSVGILLMVINMLYLAICTKKNLSVFFCAMIFYLFIVLLLNILLITKRLSKLIEI